MKIYLGLTKKKQTRRHLVKRISRQWNRHSVVTE